jgi:hypothetical protein
VKAEKKHRAVKIASNPKTPALTIGITHSGTRFEASIKFAFLLARTASMSFLGLI